MSSSTLTRFSQAGTTTSMKAFYSSIMVGSPFVSQNRESKVNTATTRHSAVLDYRWPAALAPVQSGYYDCPYSVTPGVIRPSLDIKQPR